MMIYIVIAAMFAFAIWFYIVFLRACLQIIREQHEKAVAQWQEDHK
jgi:hypothetical protein